MALHPAKLLYELYAPALVGVKMADGAGPGRHWLSPLRGLKSFFAIVPTAYAMGYSLSPLRG
jgi:hypothetical protein